MELLSFLYQQFGGYICIWQIYNSPSARELIKSDRGDTNRNKYMENKTKCDRCVSFKSANELLNLRVLKLSLVNKMYILQYKGKKFDGISKGIFEILHKITYTYIDRW